MIEKLKAIIDRLFHHDKWLIGLSTMDYSTLLEQGKISSPIDWFHGKFGEYIADPFIFKYQNDYFLFYELFRYIEGDAKIAVSRLIKNGTQWSLLDQHIILEEPFHQSYPYIFEYQNHIYCLPEQSEGQCVKLYQAIEFPLKWELKKILLDDFPFVDPTLFEYNDLLWLFATKGNGQQDQLLYAWYADSLEGPWQAHQKNPIKSGFGQVRPAGTPFINHSNLYRPVQGFKKRYGDSLSIYQINRLSPDSFNEEFSFDIPAINKHPHGIHHISINSGVAVFDAKDYASALEVGIKLIGIIKRKFNLPGLKKIF